MPGGKSVIYLPSVTVQIARKPLKDDGGKTTDSSLTVGQKSYSGIILRALTRKNRFIKQYLEVEMYLSFTNGLNKYYGLLDLMTGFNIIVLKVLLQLSSLNKLLRQLRKVSNG